MEQSELQSTTFMVVSYNILAEFHMHDFYPYTEKHVLDFYYRGKIILAQLEQFQADFVCLQEVERYEEYWLPKLADLGYSSTFITNPNPKTPKAHAAEQKRSPSRIHPQRRFANNLRQKRPNTRSNPKTFNRLQTKSICKRPKISSPGK